MEEVKDYPPYLDYPKPCKVQTNADKIRSMSDEELAVLLSEPCECSVDPAEDGHRECGNKLCIEYLLNWLQQPAEGGITDGRT